MTLEELNSQAGEEAVDSLLACCGSRKWAQGVAKRRPFKDLDALLKVSDEVWKDLSIDDWKEAFGAHPRIGEADSPGARFVHTRKWASDEQAQTAAASETVLALLAEGNRRYEKRFGYIFVVFATGKSAAQMLRLLKERMKNDPEDEIGIAAAEQQAITRLRLEKLIDRATADE